MRLLWLSALVVVVDQVTKAMVLRYMYRGESIPLAGDWLKLTFTENPGMAFGIEVGPAGTITWLSIVAVLLVVYYIFQVRDAPTIYRAGLAFILGGAIGNIIDRVFYGAWLGYGELFQGKVVDFIHVSVWDGRLPDFIPFIGGGYMELFPIWNVADMAIVCGVVGVLMFHQQFHEQILEKERAEREAQREAEAAGAASVDGTAASVAAQAPSRENGHGAPQSAEHHSAEETDANVMEGTPDDDAARDEAEPGTATGDGSVGDGPIAQERPSESS